MNLPYKKALITGASSGLGEALSYFLAEQKMALYLVARNQEALNIMKESLSSLTHVSIYSYDLSSEEGINKILDLIDLEKPDLVINNAGFGIYGEATETSITEQKNLLDLNIKALTLISISAAKALKATHSSGCIVQISSAAAFFPYPSFATYSASKAYVNYFSKALAYELKVDKIDVLIACPGQFTSHFRERASHGKISHSTFGTMSTEKVAKAVIKQIKSKKRIQIIDRRYYFAVRFAQLFSWSSLFMKSIKASIDKRVNLKKS